MLHIAVIIVHYNGDKETRECLATLKSIKATNFSFSVTVLDNGSKENLSFPNNFLPANFEVIRSDSNLGFAHGNNLAIHHAEEKYNPDYFLLLNNDTLVEPKLFSDLLAAAEAHPDAGMVSPMIYFARGHEFHHDSYSDAEKGNVIWFAGGSVDWNNLDAFHRGVDELNRHQFDDQLDSEFATGCCVLIPRKVINQIGAFDTRYFLYLEDADLSMRVRQAGYSLLFCPSASVWHVNAGSSGGAGSALHTYYQTRNRLFFFMKYGSWKKKVTVIKFATRLLLAGTVMEKRATLDWILGRMGKQSVL